ncbi:MAG: GDP-mannose 4,6-dehydratase [bacterium]|nr:GDP-mannose 4,6-dehydratase [bacterium]
MRAFITGITGFAGSHLAENLLNHNYEVFGTSLMGERRDYVAGIKNAISIATADINDARALKKAVTSAKPQVVFHLAALAAVGRSFTVPVDTMTINLMGTQNLYEILRDSKSVQKIVFVSSADIFGPLPPAKMPIKPDYPLHPVSPYGASKAAADILSYQYFRAYGLPIVRIRAFNHTGPRQGTGYVIPDFCSQITRIESSGRRGTIKVGDTSARRDISDVRDIVNGYRQAAAKGKPGEAYILASGKADSIRHYLKLLTNMSTAEIDIKIAKELLRPVEVPLLVGSIAKSKKELGYNPKYKIEQTLLDTLDFWRKN